MKVNLHELINQPGAGKHIPQLVKSGNWDEWAGLPMKQWSVEVEFRGTETLHVNARSKDEAYQMADKLAIDCYDDYDFLEAKECN